MEAMATVFFGSCSSTFLKLSKAAVAILLFSGESAPGMYCCM